MGRSAFTWIAKLTALTACGAQARPIEGAVVRLTSYLCDDPASEASVRNGSGVLVQPGTMTSALQIVTNAHVLWHGHRQEGVCLAAAGAGITLTADCLDLAVADVLSDLATVQIKAECVTAGLSAAALPRSELAAMAQQTPPDFSQLTLVGVPFGVRAPKKLPGILYDRASQRHSVPAVDTLLEIAPVDGLPSTSEYGMSGGAIVSADGQALLGILTEQVLATSVGQAAVLHDDGQASGSGPSVHSMAIPLGTVLAWLDDALGTSGHPYDLKAQKDGYASLVIGSLQITEESCDHIQKSFDLGDPIGGGWGVGVGGSGVTPKIKSCLLRAEAAPAGTAAAADAPRWNKAFEDLRWLAESRGDHHIGVDFFSVETAAGIRHEVHSLNQLLRLVAAGAAAVRLSDADRGAIRAAATELAWLKAYRAWSADPAQVDALANWQPTTLDFQEDEDFSAMRPDDALDRIAALWSDVEEFREFIDYQSENTLAMQRFWRLLKNDAMRFEAIKPCLDAATAAHPKANCLAVIGLAMEGLWTDFAAHPPMPGPFSTTDREAYETYWSAILTAKMPDFLVRFWDAADKAARASSLAHLTPDQSTSLASIILLYGSVEETELLLARGLDGR